MASEAIKSGPVVFGQTTKLYERHELKLLNLALLLYLCLGGLLFDSLGEFQEPERRQAIASEKQQAGGTLSRAVAMSLSELRQGTARRMWDITNQLNILYESNWTRMVLDELAEFERRFLESLAEESRSKQNAGDDEKGPKTSMNISKSRARSIKKSLIHSLATITTIGSPHGSPHSEAGKLATMLYGALGVPLLFFTVARTGRQMAYSGLNLLLILRHYCFALPVHYMCCIGGGPLACFKWLAWCCCCCCWLPYLLCCLASSKRRRDKAATAANGCDKKKKAPQLRLRSARTRRRSRRRPQAGTPPGGATGIIPGGHRQQRSAYVIGAATDRPLAQVAHDKLGNQLQQQHKSVRFVGQNSATGYAEQQTQRSSIDEQQLQQKQQDIQQQQQELADKSLFSSGLFMTSLAILSLYLSLGAYIQSRSQNVTLIEALYTCYDMLSTSKLPASFNLDAFLAPKLDTKSAYHQLLLKSRLPVQQQQQPPPPLRDQAGGTHEESSEALVWDSLFMFCGLNLLSMCANLARLWLADDAAAADDDDSYTDCNIDETSLADAGGFSGKQLDHLPMTTTTAAGDCLMLAPPPNLCNGDIPSFMGTLDNQSPFGVLQHQQQQAQLDPLRSIQSHGQEVAVGENGLEHHELAQQATNIDEQQQQQHHVNLAELFVVSQEDSLVEMQHQYSGGGPQQQVVQQQNSDASFASAGSSTDRGSLCLRHRSATLLGPAYTPPAGGNSTTPPTNNTLLYSATHAANYSSQHQHHSGHRSQQHLCLAPAAGGGQLPAQHQHEDEEGEEDDNNEMERMLKSCLGGNKQMRSSSSSIQLSHTSGSNANGHHHLLASNGFGQHQSLSRTTRFRPMESTNGNGYEQDSSPNTFETTPNSNTTTVSSSISSGRTVKLPYHQQLQQQQQQQHRHPPNGIGFILPNELGPN